MRKILILIALGVILAAVNLSIYRYEKILNRGREILLPLAPADPRSLIQGDYMRLRFRLGDRIRRELVKSKLIRSQRRGKVQVTVDNQGVARFQKLCTPKSPCESNATPLRYTLRHGQVILGTDSFFFPEGEAEKYEEARYGLFRVGEDGEMLLTGLK